MKVFEARAKYFEYEHNIRKIARYYISNYSTKNKSLREIILDVGQWNSKNEPKLNIKNFLSQRKVRNWLAHSPKSNLASQKYIKLMKKINNVNLSLSKILKNK